MPDFAPVHTRNIQIIAIALSIALTATVVELIRRDRLREEYALIWLGSGFVFLFFSIWRSAFDALARMLGIAYGPSLLLLVILVAGFLLMVHFSVIVSEHAEHGKRLAQELAIARALARTRAPDGRGRTLVVVPAYNEATSLPGVLDDLAEHAPECDVCVVDDASTDETPDIARARGVWLLELPANLGIGGAVQTGFRFARRCGYDAAVQVDGDGQHPACEIGRLLEPVRRDEADAVIGSRFLGESEFRSTAMRRVGIRLFEWVTRVTAGVTVRDTTSGFRAYNRRAVRFLADAYARDYPEVEAITRLARNGFRIVEIPVSMRARQGGESSISGLDSLYYLVKVSLASIVSSIRPRQGRRGAPADPDPP